MVEIQSAQELAGQAKQAYEKNNLADAASLFAASAAAYEQAGNLPDAAEMKNNLAVILLRSKQPEQALALIEGTPEIFANAGDPRRHAMALGNEGTALEDLHREDEAIERYRQAAEIFDQAHEEQMRAMMLESITAIQARRGKLLDSYVSAVDGMAGVKKPTFRQRVLKLLMRIMSFFTRPWS
jgi:predicted negative regulator of RcsB-dependent stress response